MYSITTYKMYELYGKTNVDKKFTEIMIKYQETFPPMGIPPENSAIFYHRESLILAYNIYTLSPSEFEGILLGLFDEFEAAEGLLKLKIPSIH